MKKCIYCPLPHLCENENINECVYGLIHAHTPSSQHNRMKNKFVRYDKCTLDRCEKCSTNTTTCMLTCFFIESIKNYIPEKEKGLHKFEHPTEGTLTTWFETKIDDEISANARKTRRRARKILLRDGGCRECGKKTHLTIDHITEISKGGSARSQENKQILCDKCNNEKSNPKSMKIKLFGKWVLPFVKEKTEDNLVYALYHLPRATMMIEYKDKEASYSIMQGKINEITEFREHYLSGLTFISRYMPLHEVLEEIEITYSEKIIAEP